MKPHRIAPLLPLALFSVLGAQDGEVPYVLESMSYVTVGEYAAGGGNVVDTSATTDGQENAIAYETFRAEVEQAHANGTGGVIDFEVDLPGNTLRAIDRTLVAGYIRPAIDEGVRPVDARRPVLDNLSVGVQDDPYEGILDGLDGSDEAQWYDPGLDPVEKIVVPVSTPGYSFDPAPGSSDIKVNPAEADPGGFLLVDPLRIIRVEDRRDRQNLADDRLPIDEGLNPIYATLRGIYGLNNENAISIRRGPMHISEASLATREAPGRREYMIPNKRWGARGTTNDEFWFRTDFSTGGEISILRENETLKLAVSGERNLSGGGIGDATAKDLLFDPRDNILKLGLTLLSHNNFQFWQGLSVVPDNPDNIIVKVWFSDGTTTDYRGTTQQSRAGADTFFGFEAPDGAAITRLQLRVVGRNYRTFTNIDDIGFITGPSAPYLSAGAEPSLGVPSAARGRNFVRALEFQRNPDSVEIAGLEALGLSLDAETGLITGVVDAGAPDSVELPVRMSNADGERTEPVRFAFSDSVRPPGQPAVRFAADTQALATLGRDFNYTLRVLLDGVREENVEFFAVARRMDGPGGNPVIPLSDLGLSLSDNVLSGKVVRSSAVGTYELLLYAMSPEGGAGPYPVQLKVVPPTPEPNFDGLAGNLQTDLVRFDPGAGTLSVSLFRTDPGTGRAYADDPVLIASSLPADTVVFTGEFNGDANTDLLTFSVSEGVVRVFAMAGAQATVKVLRNWGPGAAGWRVVGVGDLNVDGITDVVIDNPLGGVQYVWILRPLNLGTLPLLPIIDFSSLVFSGPQSGNYRFLAAADLNGDGGSDLIWRHLGSGEYVITPFNDSQFTGSYGGIESLKRTERVVFTMEEGFEFHSADDVNGDGLKDLLWHNPSTSALAVWEMAAAAVPEDRFELYGSSRGYLYGAASAGPDGLLLDAGTGVPVRQVDLDNDSRSDLILEDPDGETLHLILLDGAGAKEGEVERMEDGSTPRPQQLRDDGSGLRQFQLNASKTLLDNFPVPADWPLALESDEALGNYQIYEQARDPKGNLLWTIASDGFHALPDADTSKPLPGRDVFLNGMHARGEALAAYVVFERDGDDGQGRPAVKTLSVFGSPIPVQKRVDRPKAAVGTRDRVWTPMASALDGSPFMDGVDGVASHDARGNRGFLQSVDARGTPVLEQGKPLYELWRNSAGLTVEEQSVRNAIEAAVRSVIGGPEGDGTWVAGLELTPFTYLTEQPAGVTAEAFLYGNRRAVSNAIFEAFELAGPGSGLPASALLPEDPAAYDPGADLVRFDVLLTANENAIEAAVSDLVESAGDEVVARGDELFSSPLYDPLSDSLEAQLAALRNAIVNVLRLFSRDAAGFSSPGTLFTEGQLDLSVRRAITAGVTYGVEQAGLVPGGPEHGLEFKLEPDDIKLYLAGGEASDILDMKYAMVEALYVAAEKLQGLAVQVAVADAVNEAFAATVSAGDIPIDLVSRSGNVFERLSAAEKESAIENAIIVGIEQAAQVGVTRGDLAYTFFPGASRTQKAQAIASAIAAGISAAGGDWTPVPFIWPKDVTTRAEDLFNGYRESNSFQQNATALNTAVAYASNRETGGSLTGREPAYPAFVYFTNAELAGRVSLLLALAVDRFGGEPDEVAIEAPADPANPEPSIRAGLLQSVKAAFLKPGEINEELVFPQGANAADQSRAARRFVARAVKARFYRSDIDAAAFPLSYADADPLASRERALEEGIRLAIAQEIPGSSFPDTAAAIPARLSLFDAEGFARYGDESFVEQVTAESLAEALTAAVDLTEGFSLTSAPEPLAALAPTIIADNIAQNVSTAAFGPLDEQTGVEVPRVRYSVGSTSADNWRDVSGAVILAVDAAFPGTVDGSVLDSFGSDPFAGLDFDGRGEVVLQALAAALTDVTMRPVSMEAIRAAAFPQDRLLYALDFDRNLDATYGSVVTPGPGFELVGTGDYDNGGGRRDNDLLFLNPVTGQFVIYLMKGVNIVGEIRPGAERSAFQDWQYRNYFPPAPQEGLLEYAQGVERVMDPLDQPQPVVARRMTGGPEDGAFAIEFDFRTDDPSLDYVLEECSDLLEGAWEPVESVLVEEVDRTGRPASRRLIRPQGTLSEKAYYRLRFLLSTP